MDYLALAVYTNIMHRSQVVRLAAITLLIPVAVAGCGPKSTAKSSSSSQAVSTGSCSTGYVSGQIAGQPKCLQNGQQCQDANASDYKKYGFTCAKNNGRYELKKS